MALEISPTQALSSVVQHEEAIRWSPNRSIEEHKLDIQAIRSDFPILAERAGDKKLVYLDSAATSQKPNVVIEAINNFYRTRNANVHRGVHMLAERATNTFETARKRVAQFINAPSPNEIVWTKNASEAINLVAHSYGRKHLQAGDEVVISRMEHHSNIVPWHLLARDRGVIIRGIELEAEGTLRLEDLDRFLASGRVKLVALTHVSNVLGTINPIAQIGEQVHRAGAVFMVDGCQAAPHLPVDVQALGADFYAFSAHKMLGPTGLGVLYGRSALLAGMDPFLGGGEMIEEVRLDRSTYALPPHRFEAGTPPIAETAGLLAAIDYLEKIGMSKVRAHERALTVYALERLAQVPSLKVHGSNNPDLHAGAFSFELGDIHAHDVAQVLDAEGVAVRAGHHCAQPLMEWLGVTATARASIYIYNTEEEIDTLVAALEKARAFFM